MMMTILGTRRRARLAPDPIAGTSYRWNEVAARYISANGRFVARTAVRLALDEAIVNGAERMVALSRQVQAGTMSLADWQLQMMAEIKATHLASGAAASGGWAQLSQADYGRIGQRIRVQYQYLRNFADEIASGKQRLDGTLIRRTELYNRAGRETYHLVERTEMGQRGYDQERSVLRPGDNCRGCIEEDRKGWQPLGSLVPIGQRDCRTNCRCFVEYRNRATAEATA
jgi:hypothetical protein